MILAFILIACVLPAAAHAQVFQMPQGKVSNMTAAPKENGKPGVYELKYDLESESSGMLYAVTVEVSFDKGKSYVRANAVKGDVGTGESNGGIAPGRNRTIEWDSTEFKRVVLPDAFQFVVHAVGFRRRPRPVEFSASLFTSLEPRQTTSLFGAQQARGGNFALRLPFKRALQIGFEVSSAWRDALDSAQTSSSAERRFLKDTFLSATVGRRVAIGTRADAVLVGGGGFAVLHTRRFNYTLAGATVETSRADFSKTLPAIAAGLDLRIAMVRRLSLLASYRLHAIAGDLDASVPRERVQHRPGIGVVVRFGDQP